MKEELGLTVSIGVSFSKVIAKLGSDMKKPDAVTVLMDGWKERVWPLPASELLFVGRQRTRRLNSMGMLSLCHSLLKSGILSQSDFDEAERCLHAKYQPIFTAA